jgi:hypothetical protein
MMAVQEISVHAGKYGSKGTRLERKNTRRPEDFGHGAISRGEKGMVS